MTVNPAMAPVISSLYAAGKMEQLQRVVTKSARWTFLACLPLALGFLFLGRWYLLLIFGRDFAQGQTALAILTVGQLVNVATGSVGYLLIMTGHEREAAKGMAVSALLNIALNAALIPTWGLEGAATAGATSMMLANIWFSVVVYRKLGIHSTALGRLGSRTPPG
jgi:O-antigen/teichoic acid export membrane protein